MGDAVYTEGFPDGWRMVHRPDTTLLIAPGPFMATIVCAAPRLMQGEEWLGLARQIANALVGVSERKLKYRMKAYCDGCGYGPSVDEQGDEVENSRALKDWTCDNCDHRNIRNGEAP